MRILQLHCDSIEYTPTKKKIKNAEEDVSTEITRLEELVVAFVAVEKDDDSSIRKSLDNYVKHRLKEIPFEIKETFLKTTQIWKCENELDFLYGYYVGKLEEGSLHFLLKA